MPETGTISKISLPNGDVYSFQDENVGITSTYDSSTKTVILTVGSLGDADSTEY
jgi:archaellum component FlaF (FlaF/FlaG flagellin family)